MMSDRHAILGVEGPHDQAFVARVLHQILGFQEFKGEKLKLDPFWEQFVPKYPPQRGRLYARLAMPSILFNKNLSIAIYAGEGDNLRKKFPSLLKNHPPYYKEISAFGIVADSDTRDVKTVAQAYSEAFKPCFL